jgi:predicted acylesterase/phospholipase RssA
MGDGAAGKRQLRFALSMNGGVSLAVWIGGGVAEIDAVRRGEAFWGDLLEACGYERAAQVDVMSGASAGGLNAVMMAEAIRRGVDFNNFLDLWEESADIGRLVKPPSQARKFDPRAVLDGRYFERELFRALTKGPEPRPELDQDLAVFASATLVTSGQVELTDVPGAPIRETRSDAHFHVARRGLHAHGLDGFQPSPLVMDNARALAKIGRATSSLPGLFEPVTFCNGPLSAADSGSSVFGSRLVNAFTDDTSSVEIMDGGITDNVPIARAIRAIASSRAEGRARRVLLYLHPDPGGFSTDGPPKNVLDVVRAFFGKRKETVREDIDVLRQHNEAVRRRQSSADAVVADIVAGRSTVNRATAKRLSAEISRGVLLRTAIDPSSELPWHAPNVARVTPLIDRPGSAQKAAIELDIKSVLDIEPDVLVALPRLRALLAIERLLRGIEAIDDVPDLSVVNRKLYDTMLMCDLVHGYQLARFLGHGAPGDPSTRLIASLAELGRVPIPGDDLPVAVISALASWDLSSVSAGTVDAAPGGHMMTCLDGLVDGVVSSLPEIDPSLAAAAVVIEQLRSGATTWQQLERTFIPLAVEPAVSDQYIEFIRIAGNVTSPASERFSLLAEGNRGPKIAGTQLGHLGAFFAREWRTNDWWWGRLDTVDALLEAVLDDDAIEHLHESGYLDRVGLAATDRTIDDVKAFLLRLRQRQLIDRKLGTESGDFAAAVASPEFEDWAQKDRRLTSLLGSRTLTSSAIRGVMTASKVAGINKSRLSRAGLFVVRPLLLALTGMVMAGRGAASAAIWTFCVLMAPRFSNSTTGWIVYAVGVALAVAISLLVELRIRPTGSKVRYWPYPLALIGLASGAAVMVWQSWIADHHPALIWLIAAAGAAVASFPLFYWAAWPTCAVFVTVVFLIYGASARLAQAEQHTSWFDVWPIHSLWVWWMAAIMVFPILLGRLPDNLLMPRRPSANADFGRDELD